MNLVRIPSGIESLDQVLQGGFPSGSLVLLLGEIGAGDFEFAFTSSARMLMKGSENIDRITKIRKVSYISFTRSKEDVLKEIALSFPDYYDILQKSDSQNTFEFKDFSDAYFAKSFLPVTWRHSSKTELSFDSLKWNEGQKIS